MQFQNPGGGHANIKNSERLQAVRQSQAMNKPPLNQNNFEEKTMTNSIIITQTVPLLQTTERAHIL